MTGLKFYELLIILLIVLILFGSSKIPQLMRSMGAGIHEFKEGVKDGASQNAAADLKSAETEKK